jgi:hypothetical protein
LTNTNGFSVATSLPLNVPAGNTAVLTVLFNVTAAGGFSFDMDIADNDANENPYDISITGTGTQPYVVAKLKAWLEGPYQTGSGMTTLLKTAGSIPATSPYADGRTVALVPDGVTDWISMELRSAPSGPSEAQRSFFLKSDGSVVDTDGTTADLQMPGPEAASYFIVLRHRNHLTVMSASAQSLGSASPPLYDFTTGTDKYYGTGGTKDLGSGVYGMMSGDANGNGYVNATDYLAVKSKIGQTVYFNADCNLNGYVNATDYLFVKRNVGKSTQVP